MKPYATTFFLFALMLSSACENVHGRKINVNHGAESTSMTASRSAISLRVSKISFDQATYDSLTAKDFAWAGMIYNKWWTKDAIGATDNSMIPPNDNATWTASGNTATKGSQTWRCKSCHGWDYIGKDGMYADTKHKYYTGISGIIQSSKFTPATMGDTQATFTAIESGVMPDGKTIADHNFGTLINNPVALHAITKFVETVRTEAITPYRGTTLQGSPTTIVTNLTLIANQAEGYAYYHLPTSATPGTVSMQQGGCHEGCHGADGTAIVLNGGDPNSPNTITDAILFSPAEALHKIRFGQPGVTPPMPGLDYYDNPNIVANTSQVVATNILAFSRDGLLADHARGGRLYDNWVLETGGAAPSKENPLVQIRSPNPNDIAVDKQWLCSSCHGYDYEGVTGFQNNLVDLKTVRNWSPGYLFNYLKQGRAAFSGGALLHNVHSFSEYLSDPEIWHLAEFLMEGVVDTHTYISLGLGGRALGEGMGLHGERFYYGEMQDVVAGPTPWSCIECHSDSGNGTGAGATVAKPPVVDIFAASWQDVQAPWRMFHRVRFGVPGYFDLDGDGVAAERMPGLTELVLSDPFNPAIPLAEEVAFPLLNHRAVDIVTYAQDVLMSNSPSSVASIRQRIAASATSKR